MNLSNSDVFFPRLKCLTLVRDLAGHSSISALGTACSTQGLSLQSVPDKNSTKKGPSQAPEDNKHEQEVTEQQVY